LRTCSAAQKKCGFTSSAKHAAGKLSKMPLKHNVFYFFAFFDFPETQVTTPTVKTL